MKNIMVALLKVAGLDPHQYDVAPIGEDSETAFDLNRCDPIETRDLKDWVELRYWWCGEGDWVAARFSSGQEW